MRQPAPLIATYRLQLRNGVDLDRARDLLPWLRRLGVSHLYLAPPFHAAEGSTHGYDVVDPTCIDPVLGGNEAFRRLSDAAQASGIGIVIDIVPNHMAFTPANPWLADVLRQGASSKHARIFDIDWSAGRLHFPVLDGHAHDLLRQGGITFVGDAADPRLRVYDREYPLRPSELAHDLAEGSRSLDVATLDALLAEQHWSLGDWRTSVNSIIHRRFFNITDLIGVRQEDPEVFALTHSWILDNVSAGRIQGLRVDHIDGLARPGQYLGRLREAVGHVPVWIEKIVKEHEEIPRTWPVEGMSGYEFMTPVTRLLTDAEGLAAMREAARGAVPADYGREVRVVRRELLADVFNPEVRRVASTALAALALDKTALGDVIRAVTRLAVEWPVYRSYAADCEPLPSAITECLATLNGDATVAGLVNLLRAPDDAPAQAFASRLEQLTGALTAKSEEDTVFFRSIAFLPFCEVGAEPSLDPIDARAFEEAMNARAAKVPLALNALSTHDTKRSADARAILIALSRVPDLARELYAVSRQRAVKAGVTETWGIYAVQTALMLRDDAEAADRIGDHIAKAMREAKDLSHHEAPDIDAEAAVTRLCLELHEEIRAGTLFPASLAAAFDAEVEAVILMQAFLQLTAPGIPDIYQGSEGIAVTLTDPDNRCPVDWSALEDGSLDALSARKLELTTRLLGIRAADPELFAKGSYSLWIEDGRWMVDRAWQGRTVTIAAPPTVQEADHRPEAQSVTL